ncbi:MAG: DUF4298 domain-containing protein [Clostridia bacterium]|nr:DUF4298 domain-containing protein [Clostridia bacterium]
MQNRFETPAERITFYEETLDRCLAALAALQDAPGQLDALRRDAAALEAYYTSRAWRDDFEADEAGRLPAGLKRGVLSEDGIDSLLEDCAALFAALREQLPPVEPDA